LFFKPLEKKTFSISFQPTKKNKQTSKKKMSASSSSSFSSSSSYSEISKALFAALEEKELAAKSNAGKDVLSSLNETEKNFIKNVLAKAIVTPDPSGNAVKIHVMDVDFYFLLDKKEFLSNLVLGSSSSTTSTSKTLEQRVAETVFSIVRNFLMWVTESMVPGLFDINIISKLEIFNSILKIARAIEDEWKRSIWQNKFYYTSVVYKGGEVWTVHIARYVDQSAHTADAEEEQQQQRQPFISCRFSPEFGIVFWNHKRPRNTSSCGITSASKTGVSLVPCLVESEGFKTMLEEIGAWYGGDVNLLSIILLSKMLLSKKNYTPRSSAELTDRSESATAAVSASEWKQVSSARAKKQTYADRLKK